MDKIIPDLSEKTTIENEDMVPVDSGTETFFAKQSTLKTFYNGTMPSDISTLQGDVSDLQSDVSDLQSDVTTLKSVARGYFVNNSGQSFSSGIQKAITGWGKIVDSHSIFNTSTGILTIPFDCYLNLTCNFTLNGGSSSGFIHVVLIGPSSFIVFGNFNHSSNGNWSSVTGTCLSFPAYKDQTYVIRGQQNFGGTLSIPVDNGITSLSFELIKV